MLNNPFRKLRGLVGLGATWGAVWSAFVATLLTATAVLRPVDVAPIIIAKRADATMPVRRLTHGAA